ncbi:MAG: hypothetical protein NTY90_04200, partial [Candidatus Micrarchaeota archaeon]|nr:hypothetical protein [Candidatus Micrarchaeota archaeon]
MGQKQKPVRRLKHILFIADGMADYPCPELGGKTPLEAADAPNMRALARESVLGRVKVAGDSCGRVFSDTAFLSILGYGPDAYPGRGPLEALAAGVKFGERDVVARCNLVAIEDGRVAGYLNDLTEQETRDLLKSLDAVARRVGARFVRGSGYKHLIVIRNAGGARGARGGRGRGMAAVPRFSSPMPGESVEKAVVQCGKPSRAAAGLAAVFNEIQEESKKVFPAHPANAARERAGKKRVEMVWFWGAGRLEKRRDLAEKCGNTAVVSSVNVVNGIVKWLGGKAVEVPGATGYLDTDY